MKQPLAPLLTPPTQTDFYLEDEALFEQLAAENFDYSYLTCRNLVLHDALLKRVTLQKSRLERFEASNVIFRQCDFSNLELLGASLHQVWFDQCKLTGANFAESYLRDCRFTDCVADFTSFSQTNLNATAFETCRLTEAEFYHSRWKDLTLQHCELTRSNWSATKLAQLDFSSNQFDAIAVSQEQLKGAIVTPEQALVFARGLGLVIKL